MSDRPRLTVDEIAAMAMQGMLADPALHKPNQIELARVAYVYAEAMIEERERREKRQDQGEVTP